MKILEFFFKRALLDDPWMSLAISLGVVVGTWLLAWFLCCVIGYRFYLLPSMFPEHGDIAYQVGHLLAAVITTLVTAYLLRDFFWLATYVAGLAVPVLWSLFMILKMNAATRKSVTAPDAAAAAAAGS